MDFILTNWRHNCYQHYTRMDHDQSYRAESIDPNNFWCGRCWLSIEKLTTTLWHQWFKNIFKIKYWSIQNRSSNQVKKKKLILGPKWPNPTDSNHLQLYLALYLYMWRAKMKKWCSINSSFCSSNCQNTTVAFHKWKMKSYCLLFIE